MDEIPRLYYHYELWEEYHLGMWRQITGREKEEYLNRAIKFTGNAKRYGRYMQRVVRMWLCSCAVNLSNRAMNRQAWVGHAACCLAIGCPESITRLAWHYLTQEQQDKANLEADRAIMWWENQIVEGYQPCLNLV